MMGPTPSWVPPGGQTENCNTCAFSMRVIEVEPLTSQPVPGLDETWSSLEGRSIQRVPILRLYGSTPAGQKCAVSLHNAYPYFFLNVPETVIEQHDTYEKLTSYSIQLAHALNKATQISLGGRSKDAQFVHMISIVQAKSFYGYTPHNELFLKVFMYVCSFAQNWSLTRSCFLSGPPSLFTPQTTFGSLYDLSLLTKCSFTLYRYNPMLITRMTTLLRNKTVMATSFRIFEAHVPYILQVFIDYKIYGMGFVNFRQVKFRAPLPEPRRRRRIDLDHSLTQTASHGALNFDFHYSTTVSPDSTINAPRNTRSELEIDVDVSDILSSATASFTPNTPGEPDKMVPSLTYMWDDERRRRYEAAKLKNPHLSSGDVSLNLGSIFESSHERMVDGPHEFHRSILEKFAKVADKDEQIAKILASDSSRLISGATPSHSLSHTQILGLTSTPTANTSYQALSKRVNLTSFAPASQALIAESQVDEGLVSSQLSDESLLEALEWMIEDDWNNEKWESRVGRESDAKVGGYKVSDEEEEYWNDRDIEAIMASQRDIGAEDLHVIPDDHAPPPQERHKRDLNMNMEDIGETYPDEREETTLMESKTKKKRVSFVETTHVLHFDSTALKPSIIELLPLAHNNSPTESPIPAEWAPSNGTKICGDPERSSPSSLGPIIKKIHSMPVLQQNMGSEDSSFEVEETQPPRYSRFAYDLTDAPQGSHIMDHQVLSIPNLITMASTRFTSQFARFFEGRISSSEQPLPLSLPPISPLYKEEILELASVGDSKVVAGPGHDAKNSPFSANLAARRPMVLRFAKDPPSWSSITEYLAQKGIPLVKYQAPFYGTVSDRPAKSSKFAGVSLTVEATRLGNLPPFSHEYVDSGTSSLYHHFGAQHQLVQKKSVRGAPLRCLTPARPPPIVHIYKERQSSLNATVDISQTSTKAEIAEPHNDEEDDEYELVSNSPKLGELFKLLPMVRPTKKSISAAQKTAPEILAEQSDFVPTFGQSQPHGASQIDRATPAEPHGFALRPEARRPLGGSGLEGLTMLSIEVFANSNGPLRADPRVCPVEAIYYCVRDDFEIREAGNDQHTDKMGILCLQRGTVGEFPQAAQYAPNAAKTYFNSELELLNAFRDLVVQIDPDLVMGYECQQNSLGYVFERSIHLGIPKYIPSFGRADGDLGNQFDVTGDSWGGQHASGISMVGRVVFNVWRIMRSELALQSYSFENIAFHVLHQRIPHFDHKTLTRWYTGMMDLGAPISLQTSHHAAKKPQNTATTSEEEDLAESQYDNKSQQENNSSPAQLVQGGSFCTSMSESLPLMDERTREEAKQAAPSANLANFLSTQLWPSSAPDRWRVDEYYLERARCNFFLLDALNIVARTSEFARMYGITFYSVLSRGSQYRVESLMLRMTKPENYVCVSPTRQQVAQQLAPESIPLVMEPLSAFYSDPVLVLDFQSLYPSVMIAYNLCFSTCLGKIGAPMEVPAPFSSKRLGVVNYDLPTGLLSSMRDQIYCAPNGVMYARPEHRLGTLPRMLHEILETRVMVKESMKLLGKTDPLTRSLLDSRQLGLKLIAAVTYGYASASFSGRMPCVDVADSIVQTARETLERAIKLINSNTEWGAKVVYGDTDSMFVLLKGATKERAFRIGNQIAQRVTDDNPWPVKLKFEKVYHPCVLLAKKRYVGYMYESLDQEIPIFDAKGIETVRRDTCPAVSKILEKSLRMLFESKDMSLIKSYLRTQWTKILAGRVSIMDFVFRKEVRLGTYRGHHAPPAALVAMKELQRDPRAAPRYGERVPFVVVSGTPKSRLIDLVFHPHAITPDSGLTINAHYYITRNIVPVLSRVFDLFGVSISDWYMEMPKRLRTARSLHNHFITEADAKRKKQTIEHYYTSQYCPICDGLSSKPVCDNCLSKRSLSAFILISRIKSKEAKRARLLEVCMQCSSNPARSVDIDCDSLDCTIYYQRLKYASEARKMAAFEAVLREWDE